MIQLINGDCLEKIKDISNNSVDLVILDLPYGQTNCKWDNKINLEQLWIELKRIGKINTPYFFFCTAKFGYEIIKSNEKWFRYDLVWSKPLSTCGFLNAKKMPLRKHELIYVFYNKTPIYNINDNHTIINNAKLTGDFLSGLYGKKKQMSKKSGPIYEPKLTGSILEYNITTRKKYRLHQTEKPIELLKWIIKYYSKQNDIIFDPTMGCGSTGVACKELERNFIGIEMNKDIFEIAEKRINTI